MSIYRSVGEAGAERWLTRASLIGLEPAARADPAWTDVEDLPALAAFRRALTPWATHESSKAWGSRT